MDERRRFLREGLDHGFIDMRSPEDRPGLPVSTQFRLLRRAGWEPAHQGLWVPDPERTAHLTSCRLMVQRFDPSAHVTGASALHLQGVLRRPGDRVELLRPAKQWIRPQDGLCVHYARDFSDVRTLTAAGVRITWAARSLAELARHTGFDQLVRAVADAVQGRHCTLGQVEAELDRGRFPGCGVLRRAVAELRREHNHSGHERSARRLLRAAGVAVLGKPLPVLAGTVPVAEVDLPFFDVSYGVEIDGPHHLLAEQAARDRARDRMLFREHGIEIDRYFWFQLDEEPARFVREVTTRLRDLGYPLP